MSFLSRGKYTYSNIKAVKRKGDTQVFSEEKLYKLHRNAHPEVAKSLKNKRVCIGERVLTKDRKVFSQRVRSSCGKTGPWVVAGVYKSGYLLADNCARGVLAGVL